jgi:hypothetical protein
MPRPTRGQASVAARATSTAATTAAKPASAAAASTGAFFILRLVDLESAAIEIGAIQRLNGSGGIGLRHLYEAKAARPTRVTVGDQRDLLDGPVVGKKGTHRLIGRGEREIANK